MKRRLVALVMVTACSAPSTAYRAQWCATYCTGDQRLPSCDAECSFIDAGIDAGSMPDSGFDAGTNDAGAADVDSGQPDSGVIDAGQTVGDGGFIRLLAGDGGSFAVSAASCELVEIGLFDSNGAPRRSTGTVTFARLTGQALFFVVPGGGCTGAGLIGGVSAPFAGNVAHIEMSSDNYGPQTFRAVANTGEALLFEIDFRARLVVQAPLLDGGCRAATARFTSANSQWLPVLPPPDAGQFSFSMDAGILVHADSACASSAVSSLPVPAVGALEFGFSATFAGPQMTIAVDSPWVAATNLLFSSGVLADGARPGEACSLPCWTDGCILEPLPICQCAVSGNQCRTFDLPLACCHDGGLQKCVSGVAVCN